MQVFARLRALAEFRRRHLPFLQTVEDYEILRELGHHQVLGAPLTLKQLLLTGIGSIATLQRRLRRLKKIGLVREARSAEDRRAIELTLSPACMRAFARYGEMLGPAPEPRARRTGAERDSHHVCALCADDATARASAIAFLREGLRLKWHCIAVVPEGLRRDLGSTFRARGNGLRLSTGERSTDALLEFLKAEFMQARAHGRRVRLFGDMRWAQEKRVPFAELLDFEAKVDRLARRHRAQVVCQYHAGAFPGERLVDALKAHPDTSRFPLIVN